MNTQVSHPPYVCANPWFESLGARPPLDYSLLPDVKTKAVGVFQQGIINLSYQDMVVLFGTPDKVDQSTGLMFWQVSFLDRANNCELVIELAGSLMYRANPKNRVNWVVFGNDKRAAKAVKDYVAYHLGE